MSRLDVPGLPFGRGGATMWRPLALFVVAAATALAEARHGYFPFDEGMLLYAGHSLWQGEGLYEHVRLNCGPGIVWVVAALYGIFGESFLAVRLFMAALFVAFVLLVRGIVRTVGAPVEADLVALGLVGLRTFLHPHWLMVSYTSLSVVTYMAALRLLLATPARFGAAGALAAVAFSLKQNVGAMAGLLVVAALVVLPGIDRRRAVARSATAAAATVGAMVAGIAWQGSVAGFFHHAIATNARFAEYWHMPFPLFLPAEEILRGESTFYYLPSRLVGLMFSWPELHTAMARSGALVLTVRLAYAVPPLVIGAALAQGLSRRQQDPRRLLIAVAAAILLLMAWPLATILHWANGSLGALLAMGTLCRGVRGRVRVLAAAMALLLATGLALLAAAMSQERSALHLRIGTVMTNARNAKRVGAVLRYLSQHAGSRDRIFVVPYAPLYYLVFDRDNPIADDYVLPPWSDADRIHAIAGELRAHRVRYVIWARAELPKLPRFEEYGAPLAADIRSRYRLAFRSPGGPPHDEIWEIIER